MKTIKKVPVEFMYVGEIPENEDMAEDVIYISNIYQIAVHKCLCGCGNLSVTPLENYGWKITVDKENRTSFIPSILNNNCPSRSHYIITNNIANFV